MYQITGLPNTVKAVWRVTAKSHYGLFHREHSIGLAPPWPVILVKLGRHATTSLVHFAKVPESANLANCGLSWSDDAEQGTSLCL